LTAMKPPVQPDPLRRSWLDRGQTLMELGANPRRKIFGTV